MSRPPSTTPAGKTQGRSNVPDAADAINRMFAEFELVYHNQYNKAFPTREKEEWAKRLWHDNLKSYSPEQILNATHQAIRESEFLPTVAGVLKYIESSGPVLPLLDSLPYKDSMSREEKRKALEKLRKETGF
jgi:hypothetical protein